MPRFVPTFTVLLLFHAAFLPACKQNHSDCGTPFHAGILFEAGVSRGPQVSLVETTSVQISWSTTAAAAGAVEYGTGADLDNRIESTEVGTEHSVKLEGLTPDSRYNYRVIVEGQPLGEEHSFETASENPEAPTRIGVFGDSGSGCKPQYDVGDRVLEADPDLILHTGDINYPEGAQSTLNPHYFVPYAHLIDHVPVYTTLGNHDVKRKGGLPILGAVYLPHNSSNDTEEFYSFERGNMHIVSLDSNVILDEGGEQLKWLDADLAGTTASWKFVFFHHPPFSSSEHGSSLDIRAAVEPIFDKYHVDIVFNGHDHDYERTFPLYNAAVVATPSPTDFTDPPGTVYIVTGGGGKRLYGNGHSDFTAYSESAFHFVAVDVEGLHLTLQAIRSDGSIMDQMSITKTPVAKDPGSEDEPETQDPPAPAMEGEADPIAVSPPEAPEPRPLPR